ncbi:MAG TPA: CBS domain-containing protein [Longilinea sp.]|nr:CBS domain-containing protein [Longilinea sp.]
MVTVRDLLKTKGDQVWSVSPNTSVLDTLQLLAEKDVGALLVLEDGKIVGIISERDFVRSIAKTGLCVLNTTVLEYMTKKVITVGPDQSIEDCMQVMTKEHIRHLPVVEDGKLAGLVSIGDVVKGLISSKETLINNLQNYIEGSGYGH